MEGEEPIRPAPLGPEFSFEAFLSATDRTALCRGLADVLTARLRSDAPFMDTIGELRALGHDLWSWDDGVWGCDYMTRRPGAGLRIHVPAGPKGRIRIRFRPPG